VKKKNDETVDLEEILREMEADMVDEEEEKQNEAKKKELNEAYKLSNLYKNYQRSKLIERKIIICKQIIQSTQHD
jgi:hypothetical protein